MKNKKVFFGFGGGVAAALSAALLKAQDYDVTGVFIRIAISGYPCPAALDRIDAMRVAAHLKIPFREIDLSKEYESQVFKPSIEEFAKGRTPNPDTLCNEKIKFGIFFDYCISHGADFVATGHYAKIVQSQQKQIERSVSQAGGPRGSEFSAENYATPEASVFRSHLSGLKCTSYSSGSRLIR